MRFKIFSLAAFVFFIQTSLAQKVGIGTTTPQARLHVADSSVYFSSPSSPPGAGLTPTENGGEGLLWIAGKSALRVGRETADRWAYDNIGGYSASFGFNNRVTKVGGFAVGSTNTVSENYSIALGSYNYVRNQRSLAFGNYSRGLGDYTNAIGYNVAAEAYQSTALGRFNVHSGDPTSDASTDPILVVGNGTPDNNRSNALTILKNGKVGIGTTFPFSQFEVKTSTLEKGIVVSNTTTGKNIVGIEAAINPSFDGTINPSSGYAILGRAYGPGLRASINLSKPAGVVGWAAGDNIGVVGNSYSGIAVEASSNIGIALSTWGDIQMRNIGESDGKFLVTDATGNATWQNPPNITLNQSTATGKSEVNFRNQGNYVGSFGWSQASTRFFLYDQNTGTNPLVIKGGRVGIGDRDATTNMLEVNGNASKSSAGSWLGNSDARLKKDIQPITSALQKLMQLKGITYQWNDNHTGIKRPEGIQMGFTAQNIQQVFPEAVTTDAQGYLQTAYGTYDPLLIEAMKELLKKVEVLEAKVKSLESR